MEYALVVFVYMTLWFVVALILKRNDVADIAWGLGFIVLALFSYYRGGTGFGSDLLVTTLVTIWGSRLSYHIFKRNLNKPEDKRYVAWRKAWGKWFVPRSYLQVFILQGILMLLISIPFIIVNTSEASTIGIWSIIGLCVWLIGFYFESVGDRQLRKFLKEPTNKGKILDSGLWKYTRHPNYFGEVTMWWGIWMIALGVPGSYISIIAPITITFLILKVSGVPMLEKTMSENPLFDKYRRETSMFIPLPPSSAL